MGGLMQTKRHKVFVSYHHANDQQHRNKFERLFDRAHDILISRSVQIGDIDPYLKTETIRQKIRDEYLSDSTITVVLIGTETWKRKHVDWEIASSIRQTQRNPRSGLLGIFLPTYPLSLDNKFNQHTIPPRLYDNWNCGYSKLHVWSSNPNEVQSWIHEAFRDRNSKEPRNSYPSFVNNKSGSHWQ
jgi:hypothetical protein